MPECLKCGNQVAEGSRFCPRCGSAVADDDRTATSPPGHAKPDFPGESESTPSSVHGRFEPGTRLGTRYRIVGLLGRGGMGEVYRADDMELGQSVALKFLPERVAGDPVALDRFRGEVRHARQIAHPNVCRIYDIAEQDGHVFLSMEYIDGEDLSRVLRRLGRPSSEKAIEIARQICLGVAAAHENRVLHRDLKPANIMIDGRGRVRITDFGLAKLADELDARPERVGTPAYMAPEQLTGGKVSVRSDIYSLGLILHELFTGKRVFDTNDSEELKRKHTSGTVSTPSSISEEIDPAVERVIKRCLEPQPENRPQSVYQVLAALPGGDPLAAAVAAGETPSPELVANARDTGGLRPGVASSLLALCLAAVLCRAIWTDTSFARPAKGPAVLAVEAKQAMGRLGHSDLPKNQAAGYGPIQPSPQGDESDSIDRRDEWPPKYVYWHRWAHGSLMPSRYHNPYAVRPNDPPLSQPGDAVVFLDVTGRLLGLDVVPDPAAEPLDETDWAAALAMLGVPQAEEVEPKRKPTRPVDELRAWRVELGPDTVVHAGAFGGRIVTLDVSDPVLDAKPAPPSGLFKWIDETAETFFNVFGIVANVVMIVLAIQNVRRRRSDLRGAMVLALVMMALEFTIEVISIRIHERDLLSQISQFFGGRAGGHVVQHGVQVFIAYLAIEPYIRRLWPRMLVGVARVVSGRVADPHVGREILIGSLAGAWLATIIWVVGSGMIELPDGVMSRLGAIQLMMHASLAKTVTVMLVALAWGILFATTLAVLMVFARIVLRSDTAAIAVASIFVALQFFSFLEWLAFRGQYELVVAAGLTLLAAAAIGGAALWSGLLTVMFVFGMNWAVLNLAFSLQLGEWYSASAIMSAIFVLGIPAVGCWLSLAGQPIFKDVLAEPQHGA